MKQIARHKVLVHGESFEQCCDHVFHFFDRTSLVMYDDIQVREEKCSWGPDDNFFETLAEAEQENHQRITALVKELQQTGAESIEDLVDLAHGYPSKVLHVLSHFLDGFIGIDSLFYNLIDDSHRLPESTRQAILSDRQRYRLLHIDCFSATPEEAALLRM